jgi:hypothetical protein
MNYFLSGLFNLFVLLYIFIFIFPVLGILCFLEIIYSGLIFKDISNFEFRLSFFNFYFKSIIGNCYDYIYNTFFCQTNNHLFITISQFCSEEEEEEEELK